MYIMSERLRYECKLNNEDLRKAIREINEPESNNIRLFKVDKLRNSFCMQSPELQLINDSDEFLLKFLRARKFDHDKALVLLNNYHSQHRIWTAVFDKVKNPQTVKHVFEAGCFIVLDNRAVDGSVLCIGRPGKVDNALIIEFIAAVTISIEHALKEERNQIYGITVIQDLSFMSFEMMHQLGPRIGKQLMNLLQDCLPVRVKSVNIVNGSKFFKVIFALFHPFLKEKLKSRLVSHGTNFELLHQLVAPSVLPSKYGGTGMELDGFIAERWKNSIFSTE